MSSAYRAGQGPGGPGAIYSSSGNNNNSSSSEGYHPLQGDDEPRRLVVQHGAFREPADEIALTPSDGYFGMPGAGLPLGSGAGAAASQVPHVPDVWVRDPTLEQDATADSKAREAGRLAATQRGRGLGLDSRQQHGALASGTTAAPLVSSPPPPHAFGRGPSARDPCYPSQVPASLHPPWADPSSQHFHPLHHHQARSASSSPSAGVDTPTWSATASIADSAANGSGFLYNQSLHGSSHSYRNQHHGSRPAASAADPLPSDAPPAYSPRAREHPAATTTPPGSPPFRQPSNPASPTRPQQGYHTFAGSVPAAAAAAAAMPSHRQESEGLLAREPESMGGDLEDYTYNQPDPRWRQSLRRRWPFLYSKLCRGLALGLVLLTITSIFLAASIKSLRNGDIDVPIPSVPQKSSVLGPPDDDAPKHDGPGPDPPKPAPTAYPPFDREITFPDKSRCKDGDFKRSDKYSLVVEPGKTLLVKQTIQKDTAGQGAYVLVYGDVVFRRATDGNAGVAVELKANDESIVVDQKFDSSTQSLMLDVPHKIPWNDREKAPCLQARVTVSVPEGSKLDSLQVTTQTLGVRFLDNLSMRVIKSTMVRTTAGVVAAAINGEDDLDKLAHHGAPRHFNLDSRFVSIKTTSANIVGSWPLYDLLSLETTSGAIKAGVDPKPVDKDAPRDAKLYVKSASGNVEFWEPVHQARRVLLKQLEQAEQVNVLAPPPPRPAEVLLPPRQYTVDIHTTSGNIKGAVAFTYSAKIRSTSGTAAVDLLSVLPAELAASSDKSSRFASIETSSTSGATALRILDPFWVEENKYITTPPPPPPVLPAQPPRPPVSPGQFMPPFNSPGQDLGDPERGIVVPVGGGAGYNVPAAKGPSIYVPPGAVVPASDTTATTAPKRRGPRADAEKFLRVLRTKHSTTSANIGVRLPGCWEGDINVGTRSGRISIEGEGIKIVKQGEELPGFNRHVVARKGDQDKKDNPAVVVQTSSGDVDVSAGKL